MSEPRDLPSIEDQPEGKLDVTASYEQMETFIPEVGAMKGYDQKSEYHDLTLDEHTKQLVKNLESDPYVQGLPEQVRNLLILAGKLHDTGKPVVAHPKEGKPGLMGYKEHEIESEKIVRRILPEYFDLSESEIDFVAKLAGLHAAAMDQIENFKRNPEPQGKALKAYDNFIAKVEEIPAKKLSLDEKMRIILALNRADKQAQYNETSDLSDPKVQAIKERVDSSLVVLSDLESAMPALIKAVQGRRAGDQKAGIILKDGQYVYNKEIAPKKAPIPDELKPLGGILRDKMPAVAEIYPRLQAVKDNEKAMQGIVNGVLKNKLGLDEEQIDKILKTIK